eukprot:SAG31_NODE_1367_length_8615_cov_12.875763_2_plen_114_part_00
MAPAALASRAAAVAAADVIVVSGERLQYSNNRMYCYERLQYNRSPNIFSHIVMSDYNIIAHYVVLFSCVQRWTRESNITTCACGRGSNFAVVPRPTPSARPSRRQHALCIYIY